MARLLPILLALIGGCSSAPISPAHGGERGGTLVHLRGRGFASEGPPMVYFGNEAAKGLVVESDEMLRVIAPKGEGTGSVAVTIVRFDGSRETAGEYTYSSDVLRVAPVTP